MELTPIAPLPGAVGLGGVRLLLSQETLIVFQPELFAVFRLAVALDLAICLGRLEKVRPRDATFPTVSRKPVRNFAALTIGPKSITPWASAQSGCMVRNASLR